MMSIVLLIFGAGLLYSFWIGLQAFRASRQYTGDRAITLSFLGLNLCEPLINCCIVGWLLFCSSGAVFTAQPGVGLAMTWPMAILLLPIGGLTLRDTFCRKQSLAVFCLGVARWSLNVLIFEAANSAAFFVVLLGSLCAIGLLWFSIEWGKTTLRTFLMSCPPAGRTMRLPGTSVSSSSARQSAVAQRRPRQLNAYIAGSAPIAFVGGALPSRAFDRLKVPCPICREPSPLASDSCLACGVVFCSQIPARLLALPRYQVLRPLDDGWMSSVYLAHDMLGERLCVLKTLSAVGTRMAPAKYAEAQVCLRREASVLAKLDHRFVSHMLDWIDDTCGSTLVLEYVPGPTLADHLAQAELDGRRLSSDLVLGYGYHVSDTLCYLSSLHHPVIHCDIKPSNLILPPGSAAPVLVDFGSAVRSHPTMAPLLRHERYGTPGYAAPEQYHGLPAIASDVYGLASTLYQMLTCDDPGEHPLDFPALGRLPYDLAQSLALALEPDPRKRLEACAFRERLHRLSTTASSVYRRPNSRPFVGYHMGVSGN